METSHDLIQPTLFPRLDTFVAGYQRDESHKQGVSERRHRRRQICFAGDAANQPKSRSALLQDFSCFVASFTGESELSYSFVLRTSFDAEVNPELVQATFPEERGCNSRSQEDCILDIRSLSGFDGAFDFGLEILIDADNFNSIDVKPVLQCPFTAQYHATQLTLVLHYDPSFLDEAFADAAWNVLSRQLSRKLTIEPENSPPLSVLNHPLPLSPPSPLEGNLAPANVLHAGFQNSAFKHPDRVAIHFQSYGSGSTPTDEISFTYATLDAVTSQLALYLTKHIPKRPRHVTIVPAYMSNSVALYVSWLAVLKSGFAFCPLPIDAPPEQLRGIVEETGASLILTNCAQIGGRPWDAWYCDDDELTSCLDVNDFIRQYQEKPQSFGGSLPHVDDNDLAYVMYTSGSTGKPKGVKISHHAASCSIGSHTKHIPTSFLRDGFRWFQFAAPTFDPSIMEIFTTWWTGGTLCSAPREVLLNDPEEAINRLHATIMMATPSMASVLRPEKVPTLRHLWTMGEKLTPKVIQNFASDAPNNSSSSSHTPPLQRSRRLLNAYGPTEGSINCTIISDVSVNERGSVIGQPIDTCSILIIDPHSRKPTPVALGFSGELAIGGPQVGLGYLNRPEQTAAAFVSSSEYGRLYRTGDRARIVKARNGDLTVDYLGRITSDQVKLSGRRVELGQIESVLSSIASVTDAVAIVHQHGPAGQGSEQVVACLIGNPSTRGEDLIAACRKASQRSLPAFMNPSRYFVLDSMPRSRSGKTDRRALTAVLDEKWDAADDSAASSDSGYDSGLARSIVDEATLSIVLASLAVVCDVRQEGISPGTSLLSLGLDSLRAVRLLQSLRSRGILHLTVAAVLRSRNVQDLASCCAAGAMSPVEASSSQRIDWNAKFSEFSGRHLDASARQLNIPAAEIQKVLPTTATQSGMIASFLRSVSKQSVSESRKKYINHSVYYQASDVDHERLLEAWRKALTTPAILRTAFTPVDDELSPFGQSILRPSSPLAALVIKNYHSESPQAWEQTLVKVRGEAEASISLNRPPLQLSVIQSSQRTAYVLSLFHGIFDGGSLELIMQDVQGAYFDKDPAPRNDVDVAVRKHFSEANEETIAYWKAQYQGFEPVPFPCVSPFKSITQSPFAQVTEVIGNVTLDQLSAAAKDMSVSPLSILQAAWATILFSYTGSTTEISFGSVVSDRLEDELSSCHGPTFAVIPSKLGYTYGTTLTVGEILSHITSKNASVISHHHIPLSSLTTSEGSLPYDTLLAFQAFDKSAADDEIWTRIEYPAMEHDFATMIEVWPTAKGPLRLRATYTSCHLDPMSAKNLLHQLDDVIAFLCGEPNRSFSEAKFAINEKLQSQIPATLNEIEEHSDESNMLLHAAFERHVQERPDAVALLFKHSLDGIDSDVQWTYKALHDLASSFAVELVERFGSLSNEPVMICMEKCPELYVAVLGILLAGAGWCPIDPYSPPTRQRAIMQQTGSRIVLVSSTASSFDKSAPPDGVLVYTVDLQTQNTKAGQTELAHLKLKKSPSHLAYLIFTSGTTGLPKGVPITHGSAATAMNALAEAVPSDVEGGNVRCMQFSQYTFDVFVQDLFYTWNLGGTLISSNRQLMIQNFAELANATRATHAHLTPAFSATLPREKIKTLEVVTMIGEKLTEVVAQDWGNNMRAYNTYGPAEATVVSTLRQFTGKSDSHLASNIGVPLSSVGAYVVEDGSLVMRGGIGELALAGPQLSPGYWKLPEINAKKFIWNETLQQKLYLTGDMVRHLADGTMNFVGRKDDLVKLGGIRVELGEIAFALRDADPRIEKFEVLHCKRKDSEEKLVVAFLACPSLSDDNDLKAVLTPAAKDIARTAREHGLSVLPPYMLPATFVVLPRIPRTASAKVDRASLTFIYHSLDLATWEAVEKNTTGTTNVDLNWHEQNRQVLQIIADMLRVSMTNLRPSTSLPAIGIDSIGAIRLTPKINALGCNLSVVDAFKCRTLEDLCALTRSSSALQKLVPSTDQADQALLVLEAFDSRYYKPVSEYLEVDEITVTPTTVLQEGLLSESFKDPQAYWSCHLFRLRPFTDTALLKRSWKKVARQTDALRAGFIAKAILGNASEINTQDNLSYLQVLYDEPNFIWNEKYIVDPIPKAARERVSEIAAHHHQKLFRLPPWAIDVFRDADDNLTMMLTIHHSIYDGPSLVLLEHDVLSAYQRVPKFPRRMPFENALAAHSALGADSKDCVEFWQSALQDIEGAQETAGQNEASKMNHRILHHQSTTSIAQLRRSAQLNGLASIVTIVRTAWALLLTDLLESPRVLFAEILSDRITDSKLQDVIGPMMSTVPSIFQRKDTALDCLKEHDEFSRKAWNYRNIRSSTVRNLLKNGSSSMVVYPAMFAFHPTAYNESDSTEALWERLEDVTQLEVEHPFALNVWQTEEQNLVFELAIAENIMQDTEQEMLILQLDALVGALIDCPQAPTASLTDGFGTQLISKSKPRSDTNCPPSFGPTYWIEHWAETHPEWKGAEIALKIDLVGTETTSWTYEELNAQANRIAHWLLKQGHFQRMIGMCLGRTLMSYAVVLGIIKSGNTYLPIDDSLPAERKRFLLADSDSAIVFMSAGLFEEVEVPESCRAVDVDTDEFGKNLSNMNSSNPSIKADKCDNAYLLYTSGSTGKPKGVLVNRENLASFLEAQAEFIYDVTTTEDTAGRGRYLGLASRAFDVHLGEMFLAWKFGIAAVTAPRPMLLDDLALALSSLRITHASFVPSLLDQTGLTPEDAPDLVFLGVGGEKMSPKTKKLWGSHDRVGLINAYGPTEATIGCCSGRLFPGSDMRDIGIPLGDSQAHILVPGTDHYTLRGMPGELCFTGSLIANGYLNRPDAKGFVDDFHGRRMYRTGDIVKLGLDDHIYFLGRKDDQVKIRGQRVELGEVAEGVRTAADVDLDVAALVMQHPDLSRKQLVAFIAAVKSSRKKSKETAEVVRSELLAANSDLRTRCQKSLPSSLVPDLIVPLTFIPLAATSGKADNKLLTKIFSSVAINEFMPNEQASGGNPAAKRTMTDAEKEVWAIVSSVLKQQPKNVTPVSALFELGIDSLSGISVFSKLRTAGYDCTVGMVMKNPTIERLAESPRRGDVRDPSTLDQGQAKLKQIERSFFNTYEGAVPTRDIVAVRPCFPLQQVLVAQSMHEGSDGSHGAYVNHIRFELNNDIDIDRLRAAWDRLISENEILRTCFVMSGDDILQVMLSPKSATSLWQTAQTDDIRAVQQQVVAEIIAELTSRPPIRLIEFNGSLLLSIHHALYDGNSLEMMIQDLEAWYRGDAVQSHPNPALMLEYIASQDQARMEAHWTSVLAGWEKSPLLTNDSNKNMTLQTTARRFNAGVADLEEISTSLNITLATLLQVAFAMMMAQSLNTNDFIFGNVLSGRTAPVERAGEIMAPCIATVPLRARLDNPDATLKDVMVSVQELASGSLEFQHVSPRDLQRWAKADRALYDCLFSFNRIQPQSEAPEPLLKQTGSDISVDYPFAIEFEANTTTNMLTVSAGFTDAFGSVSDIDLLLEKVEMFASGALAQKSMTIASLGVLNIGPRHVQPSNIQQQEDSHWSPLETKLRRLFSEYTSVPEKDIRKDTAFIHLGIDSISAIRFAKQLRSNHIEVSSADIIRHNRLGALSKHLDAIKERSPPAKEVPKTNTDSSDLLAALESHGVQGLAKGVEVYECTPLQSGMLAQSLATDGALYMHHHAVNLAKDVDVHRLRQAWDELVQDLDILRTTFHWLPESKTPWISVVHHNLAPEWEEIEVSDARQYWIQLSDQPDFLQRIQQGKPLARNVIAKSPQQIVMILTLHHATYDGISLGLLHQHLESRYSGASSNPVIPFFQAAREISGSAEAAVRFWAGQVQDYPGAPNNEPESEPKYTSAEKTVCSDMSDLIRRCREVDVDVKDVCVAAFGKALACLYGRREVVFGHVIAARHSSDGNDVVGPMFNTVPFRVTVKDQPTSNRDLVRTVHDVNVGSLQYQHASLAEVQKVWRMSAADPGAQLIDSIFVYSKIDGAQTNSVLFRKPLETDMSPVPSEYRLNFEVEHTHDVLVARALSSAPSSETQSLLSHFVDAVKDILDHPTRFAMAFPEKLRSFPTDIIPQQTVREDFDIDAASQFADTIRDAMAQVAQVSTDQILLNSSIYSFGIDSIAAIQLVAKCKRSGVQISVADVLKGAMLGRICEIAAAKGKNQATSTLGKKIVSVSDLITPEDKNSALATLSLTEASVEGVFPCLPGQEYHLVSWLQSGRTLYEPGWCYKTTTKLDPERLRLAWRSLRETNVVLRTTFAALGSQQAVQLVLKPDSIAKDNFETCRYDRPLVDAAKDRAIYEAHTPSDLFEVPTRLRLIKAADGDAVMFYAHHSLYDAWSMPRLVQQLAALYQGLQPEPTSSFTDLVRYAHLSQNKEEEQAFWQRSLQGCEPAIISNFTTPANGVDRTQAFTMMEGTRIAVVDLEQACSKFSVSPHHVLLLAFARALAQATSTASPLFGFFQLGRSMAFDGIENVTGPCVNTLPLGLRSVLDKNILQSLRDLQQTLGARVPFEQSHLRTAVQAFDPSATQLPFNAYINVLWNRTALVGPSTANDEDLFQPLAIGVPTDYSSKEVIPGRSAVDALDTSFLPSQQLFVDVGPGKRGIAFGARADAALMDENGICAFVEGIEAQVLECVEALRA